LSCSGVYFLSGRKRKIETASNLSLGITSATVSCLVVPNPLLTDVGAGISTSAGNSTSSTETVSGRDSISGFTAKLWLSSTCDLRTMEVTSARLTSPERVTTAVGTSSRVAGTKSDALAGRLRHTLRCGFSSVIYFRSAKQGGVIKRTQIGKQTPATGYECNVTSIQPNGDLNLYLRELYDCWTEQNRTELYYHKKKYLWQAARIANMAIYAGCP